MKNEKCVVTFNLTINFERMRNCKNIEAFCLSILFIYTHDSSTEFLTCLVLSCLFSSARSLNIRIPRITLYFVRWAGLPRLQLLYGSRSACLPRWLWMVKTDWLTYQAGSVLGNQKSSSK